MGLPPRPPAVRADALSPRPGPPVAATAGDVAPLVDEFVAACDAGDAGRIRDAQRALVAGGPDVVSPLVDLAVRPGYESAVSDAVALLGDAAVDPLAARLATCDDQAAYAILGMLDRLGVHWARGPRGEEICRLLLARVDSVDRDVAAHALRCVIHARPANRVVVTDLARRWVRWARARSEPVGEGDLSQFRWLATDAAPAVPILVAARDVFASVPSQCELLRLLGEVGSAAPKGLDVLRAALSAHSAEQRETAAYALAEWGDPAAVAAPELVALLHDADRDVVEAAAIALAGLPSRGATTWRAVLASGAAEDIRSYALWCLARDPSAARAMVAALPTLPPEDCLLVAGCVSAATPSLGDPVAAAVARHPSAAVRAHALDGWIHEPIIRGDLRFVSDPWRDFRASGPVPSFGARLLRDAALRVRLRAERTLMALGDDHYWLVRYLVLCADSPTDPADRALVMQILGSVGATDSRVSATLDAGLLDADDGVRAAALHALAGSKTGRGRVLSPDVVQWLVRQMDDDVTARGREPALDAVRLIARSVDGEAVLEAALGRMLEAATKATDPRTDTRLADLLDLAGPVVGRLRDLVERWSLVADPSVEGRIRAILSRNDPEPEVYARVAPCDPDDVRWFLMQGAAGRQALLPYVARFDDVGSVVRALDGHGDQALETAAQNALHSGDDLAPQRRLGAARVAPCLSPRVAVTLSHSLLEDDVPDVRAAAAWSLREIEERAPGSVSVAAVLIALRDDATRQDAIRIASSMGVRGRELTTVLREVIRDAPRVLDRVPAALALWSVSGDPVEPAEIVRTALSRSESGQEDRMPVPCRSFDRGTWRGVVALFAAAPRATGDLHLLITHLDAANAEILAPAIVACGPDAARAVPTLRLYLTNTGSLGHPEFDVVDPPGEAIARALASIGAPAREALRDLWRWIAETGDVNGVGRAAVRAIEAAE